MYVDANRTTYLVNVSIKLIGQRTQYSIAMITEAQIAQQTYYTAFNEQIWQIASQ
jgi:hypothetical protein